MTLNQLHKQLSELIRQGYGRRQVCIDKSTFRHNCEGDGVIILQVHSVESRWVALSDDDGGIAVDSKGRGFVPTPRHCDGKKGSGARKDGGGSYGLGHWVASQLGLAQSTTTKFDPGLSEWLMGWPIGWSALQPLGMDKYHEWLQQHGSYSALS